MKNYWLSALLVALSVTAFSTDPIKIWNTGIPCHNNDGMNTLFGNGNKSFGAFVGFNMKMTEVNSQAALMTGGELNFIFNRDLNVGFAGYGLITDVYSNSLNDEGNDYYLEMGYGGLNIEPVLFSESLVHVTFPVLIGAGGIAETNYRYLDAIPPGEDYFDNDIHRSDFFLVAEPGVNAEINLFRFLRATGGVSYRWVSDVEIPGLGTNSLEGISANFGLRIGWF